MNAKSFQLCWDCVIYNPGDKRLGLLECRNPDLHQQRNTIRVVWDEVQGHFECELLAPFSQIIREPPQQKNFPGQFILCHYYNQCRDGDYCTYAHSISEMLYWNKVYGIGITHSEAENVHFDVNKKAIAQENGAHGITHSDAENVRFDVNKKAIPQENGAHGITHSDAENVRFDVNKKAIPQENGEHGITHSKAENVHFDVNKKAIPQENGAHGITHSKAKNVHFDVNKKASPQELYHLEVSKQVLLVSYCMGRVKWGNSSHTEK